MKKIILVFVFIPFLHEDIIPGKPWVPNGAKFLAEQLKI